MLTPGTAKNVLTVGASENLFSGGGIQSPLGSLKGGKDKWGVAPLVDDLLSNNVDGLAAFSSRGPTLDGRTKPEIVAPGTNIVSTRSHHKDATQLWGIYNAEYLYSGGTSMSTPLTAGAAAVARQYLMTKRNQTDPSGALVKAALLHTAKDLYPGQYGTGPTQELPKHRPNSHEGYGRVDMDLMTNLPTNTSIIDDKEGAGLNEEKSIAMTLKKAGGIRATLVYTDAPGAATSKKLLVNDLDLRVTGPSKRSFTLGDHTNNNEMIELKKLQPGIYKISVVGVNIPQGKNGKQPYALIVSETR
ncbi:S8 family serine peptidase [Bdellovibrionota bacterium FG-2]